jgi:hypothetical protein
VTTRARGKQPNLGFLDPILGLAPLAVAAKLNVQ